MILYIGTEFIVCVFRILIDVCVCFYCHCCAARVKQFDMSEEDSGSTCVSVEFVIFPETKRRLRTLARETDRIKRILYQEGKEEEDLAMGVAAAVREESAWPETLKNQVIEELLLEGNADDVIIDGEGKKSSRKAKMFIDSGDASSSKPSSSSPSSDSSSSPSLVDLVRDTVISDGELKFSLEVSREDLERGETGDGLVLRRVLTKGIEKSINPSDFGFKIP
jgi:hypothetical protein